MNKSQIIRTITGVTINILIALTHIFRVGSYLDGKLFIYYYSYAADILLPFALYFLLCINEIGIKFLGKWQIKALLVFASMVFCETLQYFNIDFFGVTFD